MFEGGLRESVEKIKSSISDSKVLTEVVVISIFGIVFTLLFLFLEFLASNMILIVATFLVGINYFFSIPDRFSDIGGTDLDVFFCMLIGNAAGATWGVVYAVIFTVISRYRGASRPQYRIVKIICNSAVAIASATVVMTKANLLIITFLMLQLSNVILVPLGSKTGCTLMPHYAFINTIWTLAIVASTGYLFLYMFPNII